MYQYYRLFFGIYAQVLCYDAGRMDEVLPKIIAVVGPTCSGKTGIGIALAQRLGGEIIAADSRTVYRGMDIGTAKPEADVNRELSPIYGGVGLPLRSSEGAKGGGGGDSITSLFSERPRFVHSIPHWGIDLVNPDEPFTVSQFQAYADEKIGEILNRGNVPILVGGTGLYIRAVLDRPNFAGAVPSAEMRRELDGMSDNDLFEEIAERDPDAAATIDEKNRRRLVRALEILRTTGGALADHQAFETPMYDACIIGIDVPREQLYARIDARVDEMIGNGLVDEVRGLLAQYGAECQAMTGIGYRQIVEFFEKKTSLRDAVIRIKYDSHHYAKRQETWFRRDPRVLWVTSVDAALEIADNCLKR